MSTQDDEDILAILTGVVEDDGIEIPELGVRVARDGDLAAFWDGIKAGRAGDPIPSDLNYVNPSVYRHAHQRGVVSRKELQ